LYSPKLPEEWIQFLKQKPETGMGYQIVSVVLQDGREFGQVVISGSTLITEFGDTKTFHFRNLKSKTSELPTRSGIGKRRFSRLFWFRQKELSVSEYSTVWAGIFKASIRPPGYRSAWLRPRRARFLRLARSLQFHRVHPSQLPVCSSFARNRRQSPNRASTFAQANFWGVCGIQFLR
jgi:hypothetical protein